MKLDSFEWSIIILLGICLVLIGIAIGIEIGNKGIVLSQETADKICLDLTNESGVVAKDYYAFEHDGFEDNTKIAKGELYCQLPSYDETHLIKVGN